MFVCFQKVSKNDKQKFCVTRVWMLNVAQSQLLSVNYHKHFDMFVMCVFSVFTLLAEGHLAAAVLRDSTLGSLSHLD